MCVNYYGFNKLNKGMKLPKYNLSYNTRDVINSVTKGPVIDKIALFVMTFKMEG